MLISSDMRAFGPDFLNQGMFLEHNTKNLVDGLSVRALASCSLIRSFRDDARIPLEAV